MSKNDLNWYDEDTLQDDRALSGNDTKIFVDGVHVAYAEEFEWSVENDKKSFSVLGASWEYERDSIKKGTFKFTIYKTDSLMIKTGFKSFEIMSTTDADKYGAEKLRFKNCKLKKLGANHKAGDLIKEEWEGSFSGFEPLDLIGE